MALGYIGAADQKERHGVAEKHRKGRTCHVRKADLGAGVTGRVPSHAYRLVTTTLFGFAEVASSMSGSSA